MFNENLRKIRLYNKKTQKQVADHLHISTQSVSKWEKGNSFPCLDFLPKMATFFGCTINTFFSDYELKVYLEFGVLDQVEMVSHFYKAKKSNKNN